MGDHRVTTTLMAGSSGTDGSGTSQVTTATAARRLTREDLLGRVMVLHLWDRLTRPDSASNEPETSGGTARFILDCLTAAQTAAIARAVLVDRELSAQVDIKLPASLVSGFELPAQVLTDERTTYFRNAPCSKPALLLANTGDDEEQSLRELVPISAPDLQAEAELWVQVAGTDLVVTEDERKWWAQALIGLQGLHLVTLDHFGDYVLRTRILIDEEGLTVLDALDTALPAMGWPKNAGEFSRIAPRARGQAAKWRAQYSTVHGKRACFLAKQTPSGIVLTEDELRAAFDRVKDDIPEACHQVVHDFIAAPGGWTDASSRLAECDWEDIKPLFDGLRREGFNLGKTTLDFYGERDPGLLTDSERGYLERLSMRRTTEAALDDDRDFHDAHRDELREDRKLKSAWDRFIFGAPKETYDFLAGLVACLEGFSWEAPSRRRKLSISCERRFARDFRDLNIEAGLYFARRYGGLRELFERNVVWNVGELFKFPELVESWRRRGQSLNHSEARSALQLKFVVSLEFETANNETDRSAAQFIWRYNSQWMASELVNDWDRLAIHPLVLCRADREPTSSKGAAQSVDLWNVRTLMAAHGQDRGSLVGIYRSANDLGRLWRQNLGQARARRLVSDEAAQRLGDLFDGFAQSYTLAIQGFIADGLASSELDRQLKAYGELLDEACREATSDRTRQLLLRPLLEIGTVGVQGGRSTAIIPLWHPLRIAAMGRKARRVAELVHHLRTAPEVEFGDPRLFFRELREELAHPHYPEVALGWQGNQPELLALSDTAGDYTLHESPFAVDAGADDTNENPAEGASRVAELVGRYLALQPHEQANLSVVLYNCDSSRLPLAVVEKLAVLQQDEEDIRCHVVLRHRDPKRLARLYEQIVDASDSDGDAYVSSETTRDFMARLRIGISADQAPPPDPRDGCPNDIVFSQDLIARHGKLEWYPEKARPADPVTLNPAQWSRRRPLAAGDMKSVVYLTCPVQRAEGWSYLTAIASFFRPDWDPNVQHRLLPARQLDFRDATTARIFDETHNLANWVTNYDELLDRRQLVEQGVRIIRYKQIATQGRNLIISSRAPTGLLRSMVVTRLRDLQLGMPDSELYGLADRFINDANDVSGDIVLRAARRGRSASELMGVVLSRYLVRHELGQNQYAGWYFLDDYADWLGQQEEHIADLLALSPRTADGTMQLLAVVTESKYIDAGNLAAKRKESQKQLRDTLRRMAGGVMSAPVRLDREVWLARLSDLLVDGVTFPAGAALDLPDWRRAVREGRCAIELRGYSHIFVCSPVDAAHLSARTQLPEAVDAPFDAHQELFGRDHVRELVLNYYRDADPGPLRRRLNEDLDGGGAPQRSREPQPSSPPAGGSGVTGHASDNAPDQLDSASPPGPPLPPAPDSVATHGGGGPSSSPQGDAEMPPRVDVEATTESKIPVPNSATEAEDRRWPYPGIASWVAAAPAHVGASEEDQAWLQQVESTAKGALHQFQLQAKLLRSVLTPNAALLKFRGSANMTVDQVLRRRLEFLTTYGLNVVGVQPESGVVSMSIARPRREVVSLRSLWQRWIPDGRFGNQTLLIGVREDDGELLTLSPGEHNAPHTLIAGSTGSGKSVLMQNIILSIAATNLPGQARITLVDPKQGVDYYAFEDLPHLEGGIIDRQEDALARIRMLVDEMDARYIRMRRARAANLRLYNASAAPADQLPTLWLIHDEFAEWMLTEEYKEEVASAVQRLGVKARAAGIYLVFAAQRPEVNVMPMQLRANLGNRLILRVDSEGTSEIALGDKGAERLLGKGHLLARLEGVPSLVYAQVPYATASEIDELVALIRSSGAESLP
jgi:DNA segregation ATPase FtsK/SpoIIIE, S-DNA-T family